MKKWTVMFVPEGLGTTRTMQMASHHLWTALSLVLGLALVATFLMFASAYLFQQTLRARTQLRDLERTNRELSEKTATSAQPSEAPLSERQVQEIEQRLRDEYEASTNAIVTELSQFYVEEAKIRKARGLPPRSNSAADYLGGSAGASQDTGGGKGGAPASALDIIAGINDTLDFRPPQVIYGLANPSADLIIQEIRIRTASYADLYSDMLALRDRMERAPSEWPVQGSRWKLSSRFGLRTDPFTRQIRHHDGIDISAPSGTPVVAPGRGRVIFTGRESYLGNVVRLDHGDGYVTTYAHLSKISVVEGEEVKRGDRIGAVGSTGRSTGPHLHYELRINDRLVDPLRLLP